MKTEKMDIKKVLAMLAQPQEVSAPLKNVERIRMDIPYITKERVVEKRPVQLFLPEHQPHPMPLIYVPHYEMGEDAIELRTYLEKGWAVASVAEFNDKYNGQLTDDDLVFNNAALYTLRSLPQLDKTKIALVGGSAGAYMTLMLNALQLGICCSVANAPVTNIYFNFYRHFQISGKPQEQVTMKSYQELDMTDTGKKKRELIDVMKNLVDAPIPFLTGVADLFLPILNNFPDWDDVERFEAFSPVALTALFNSPIMINHFLSDVLVPVDQVSRRYTYDKLGDSFSEDYDFSLPKCFPGKLGCSLEECLPKEEIRIERIPLLDADEDAVLPFAADKRFNLNIYDDGPIESYGSHRVLMGNGRMDDTPYLEQMFSQTAAGTNVLSPEKLRLFVERYQGNSVQLPAHEGVDDSVYGSLEVYRIEVCEELAEWQKNNSTGTLDEICEAMLLAEENLTCRENLQRWMQTVKELL